MQEYRFENIPDELKQYPQWVVWKNKGRKGDSDKIAKVPYRPRLPQLPADITNPQHWASFSDAVACFHADSAVGGIGFCFTDQDPFYGIDIDDEDKVAPEAMEFRKSFLEDLQHVKTYMESSPSGNGFHVIAKGKIPEGVQGGRRSTAAQLEFYGTERYFTMTGRVFAGYETITEQQAFLDKLLAVFPERSVDRSVERTDEYGRSLELSDAEVIQKAIARNASFSGMFYAQVGHMPGQWSDTFYQIVGDLDYVTGDPEQLLRIVMNAPIVTQAPNAADGQSRAYKASRTFEATLRRVRGNGDHLAHAYHTENGRRIWEEYQAHKAKAAQEQNERASKISGGFSKPAQKTLAQYPLEARYLELSLPPGMMGRYIQGAMGMCQYPYLKYALPVALAVFSGILGRKFKLEHRTGLGLNTNFLLIAPSGSGKTDIMSAWEKIMRSTVVTAADRSRVFNTSTSSIQGIHEDFNNTLSGAWFIDECSDMITKMSNPKTATDEQLRNALNKLYDVSQVGGPAFRVPASRGAQNAGLNPIDNLNISCLWATTPSKFDATTTDAEDGFLSRLSIVYHNAKAGQANRYPDQALPDDLARTLMGVVGTLKDFDLAFDGRARDQTIPIDISAISDRHHEMRLVGDRIREMTLPDDQSLPKHYTAISRLSLNALKIAGTLAVMDNPWGAQPPRITVEQYDWALGYVLRNALDLLSSMDQGAVGVSMAQDVEVVVREMKRLLRKHKSGVKRSDLYMTLKGVKPFKDAMPTAGAALDRTIKEMVANGQLVEHEGESKGGRRPVLLSATDDVCWA